MKLIILINVITIIQVTALPVHSQSERISLSLNEVSVKDALDEIENISDYYFLYSSKMIDVDRKVSINKKNERIDKILEDLFQTHNIGYSLIDKQIILTQRQVLEKNINLKANNPQPGPTVKGTVIDESGEPVIGVTVMVKGTSTGTITSTDGSYSLANVPDNAILVFSFVGMKTLEIPVAGQTTINASMEIDAIGIEEVVAVGYGTQKKVNLTGSVATIEADELIKRPIANVGQMIQGKIAGVSVYSNSGQPGNESTVINIRGFNSFGSDNNPTVLVDGIEGSLNDLNPEDVESISVLKDAASAAIYGSRAANGVILVTTKTGQAGTSTIEYNGNYAIHTPARMPEQVTDIFEYMDLYNIAQTNAGNPGLFSDDIIQKFRTGELETYNDRDKVIKNPFVQKHNLRLTGGNDKTRYNFSAGIWDQPGVVIGSDYNRNNIRLNVDSDINKNISFGASIAGVKSRKKDTGGYTGQMVAAYSLLEENPYPLQFPDGRYVDGIDLDGTHTFAVNNHNPIQEAEMYGRRNEMFKANANAYIQIKPFKGFTWRTTGAINYDHDELKWMFSESQTYRWPDGFTKGVIGVNELILRPTTQNLTTLFSTVNYAVAINENHNLNVLAGYSQEDFSQQILMGRRRGLPNGLTEINAGELDGQAANGSSFEWAVQSYFGRLNYDFKGKYLAEVNFRYDGSSRFHKDNRWGLFPSFSAGWRISEEDFAQNLTWLSNFKIRASWGQLGNQVIGRTPGDAQDWNRYEFAEPIGIYPYQPKLILGDGYTFNGSSIQQDVVQEELENSGISWETTTIANLGVDLNILNGLFSLTFDVYDKKTTDILRIQQTMGHVGLGPPTVNSGAMRNTGFDFVASHRKAIGDFYYGIDLTFTRFKNEVTDFGAKEITGISLKENGIPYDSYYMLEFDGIFQSEEDIANSPTHLYTPAPGDIKLKDQDGDGTVDPDKDRVLIDGRYPDFSYGANIDLSWKNFDLSLFFQGVEGIKHLLQGRGVEPFNGGLNVKWRDAWSPTNPSNDLPILYSGRADRHQITSSFFLQDASYLRLKNIQLGYNVPKSILGNGFIKSLRVYFSGDNLITITSFEVDPERDAAGDRLWASEANYPQIKVISFGIKSNF